MWCPKTSLIDQFPQFPNFSTAIKMGTAHFQTHPNNYGWLYTYIISFCPFIPVPLNPVKCHQISVPTIALYIPLFSFSIYQLKT